MRVQHILAAAALALTIGTAEAEGLKPIQAQSIDLGGVSGVAYYTVEPDGFHVVATLAEGEAGVPIRVQAVLATGQSLTFSTPAGVGIVPTTIVVGRRGEEVVVEAGPLSN
jgi:hypothetical protein